MIPANHIRRLLCPAQFCVNLLSTFAVNCKNGIRKPRRITGEVFCCTVSSLNFSMEKADKTDNLIIFQISCNQLTNTVRRVAPAYLCCNLPPVLLFHKPQGENLPRQTVGNGCYVLFKPRTFLLSPNKGVCKFCLSLTYGSCKRCAFCRLPHSGYKLGMLLIRLIFAGCLYTVKHTQFLKLTA